MSTETIKAAIVNVRDHTSPARASNSLAPLDRVALVTTEQLQDPAFLDYSAGTVLNRSLSLSVKGENGLKLVYMIWRLRGISHGDQRLTTIVRKLIEKAYLELEGKEV